MPGLTLIKPEGELSIFIKWLTCMLILMVFLLIVIYMSNYFSKSGKVSRQCQTDDVSLKKIILNGSQ